MYRCECCGHMSEGEGFIGDICSTCGWEEGVDENLFQGRANFHAHGNYASLCDSCRMIDRLCMCGYCEECGQTGPHLCTAVYPNFHCTKCECGLKKFAWFNCECITPKWAPGPIPADKKKTKRDTRLKCPPSLRIVSS